MLKIKDLSQSKELDHKTMTKVSGGHSHKVEIDVLAWSWGLSSGGAKKTHKHGNIEYSDVKMIANFAQ